MKSMIAVSVMMRYASYKLSSLNLKRVFFILFADLTKSEIRISKIEIYPVESSEGGPPMAAFHRAGPNTK